MKPEKTNPKSALSIPSKWQEKFVLKRIDEEDIILSLKERNAILKEMAAGQRFVQIGKYTLMINSISSIDPYWGADNIPPCPEKEFAGQMIERDGQETFVKKETKESQEERALWAKIFGKNLLEEENT